MQFARVGRPNRWAPEMRGHVDPAAVPYVFAASTEDAVKIISTLGPDVVAVDTETVYVEGSVDPLTAQLRVISIATSDANGNDIAYVLDVKDMDRLAIGQAFKDRAKELGDKRLEVLGFNANFDDPVTTLNLTSATAAQPGFRPLLQWVDLMFGVTIRRLGAPGNGWWSLAKAAKRYLGVDMEGKGSTQLSYDADTPLTEEQIAYAAQDAVVTLWLGDALVEPLEQDGLMEAFTLEVRSRPFLFAMTTNGLAFNEHEWMAEVEKLEAKAQGLLTEIAELTGGQATLWGPPIPDFNPDSPDGVRKALNKHCEALVKAYLESQGNGRVRRPNTLQSYDSTDKNTLGLLKSYAETHGHDYQLIDLLLQYSSLSKIRSTYGEGMMKLLTDGRFHSVFTQCQIATGRTSSNKPNAQNFSPKMKPFFKPAPRVDENGNEHQRVHLQGDYSQAELRVSAQFTKETARRDAFAQDIDQHVAVAGQMFQVDMDAMAAGDEESKQRFTKFRGQAKAINFGLGYGMQAGLLATTLTLRGIPTSKEQAGKLIDDFFKALPLEASWLRKRDDFVHNLADKVLWGLESGSPINWEATWKLYRLRTLLTNTRTSLRKAKRPVDTESILDVLMGQGGLLDPQIVGDRSREEVAADLEWVSMYDHAVVICEDGSPWEFYSRTAAGRRRVFQVSTDRLLDELMINLSRPGNVHFQVVVDRWAAANHMALATNPHTFSDETGEPTISNQRKPLTYSQVRKAFENAKTLRDGFVFSMLDEARGRMAPLPNGTAKMELSQLLTRTAMAGVIKSQANAYRNAPIQGTVADAVLLAFWYLFDMLEDYPTAVPVLTVHDSIVLEVDRDQAKEIADRQQAEMELALARYVPDVKVRADLEVLYSLDAKSGTVPEDQYTAQPQAV